MYVYKDREYRYKITYNFISDTLINIPDLLYKKFVVIHNSEVEHTDDVRMSPDKVLPKVGDILQYDNNEKQWYILEEYNV
jgi:hypothetical protein